MQVGLLPPATGRPEVPLELVTRTIGLDDAGPALVEVGRRPGIVVVTAF